MPTAVQIKFSRRQCTVTCLTKLTCLAIWTLHCEHSPACISEHRPTLSGYTCQARRMSCEGVHAGVGWISERWKGPKSTANGCCCALQRLAKKAKVASKAERAIIERPRLCCSSCSIAINHERWYDSLQINRLVKSRDVWRYASTMCC